MIRAEKLIEALRVIGTRILGAIWRFFGIPPIEGQLPDADDEDEPIRPAHEPMFPSQMRDDPGEERLSIREEVERENEARRRRAEP